VYAETCHTGVAFMANLTNLVLPDEFTCSIQRNPQPEPCRICPDLNKRKTGQKFTTEKYVDNTELTCSAWRCARCALLLKAYHFLRQTYGKASNSLSIIRKDKGPAFTIGYTSSRDDRIAVYISRKGVDEGMYCYTDSRLTSRQQEAETTKTTIPLNLVLSHNRKIPALYRVPLTRPLHCVDNGCLAVTQITAPVVAGLS
jgi:hypothetical protein